MFQGAMKDAEGMLTLDLGATLLCLLMSTLALMTFPFPQHCARSVCTVRTLGK